MKSENRVKCLYCPDMLVFRHTWVHSNGAYIKQYHGRNGELRDDHVATPDWGSKNEGTSRK